MAARSLLVYLHRLAGLFAGLFLLVAGVTGSLLVFSPELDRWINRDLLEIKAKPVQATLDRARHAFSEDRPFRVSLSQNEAPLAVVRWRPLVNETTVWSTPTFIHW